MSHINPIPHEILVLIFDHVLNAQSLSFESIIKDDILPVNNLAFSQVCMRWRKAALGSPNLWTHIDISTHPKVILLGRIFASRSGNLPLTIRTVEPLCSHRDPLRYRGLYHFFEEFGSRTASFEVVSQLLVYQLWFILLELLSRLSSRQLVRLVLSNQNIPSRNEKNTSTHGLIVPRGGAFCTSLDPHNSARMSFIYERQLEDLLSSVQVLELDLVYPVWKSKAYHNLTELRLTGPRILRAIYTIQQLAHILTISPRLRVLHFGLELYPVDNTPQPVHLVDLEVFFLKSLNFNTQQAILRLILPGTRGLKMATAYDDVAREYYPTPDENEQLSRFFNQANVVQLYLHSMVSLDPQLLLALLPNLQSLALRQSTILGPSDDSNSNSVCPKLVTLDFISCTIQLDGFIWLVSGRHIREVAIWDSRIGDAVENDPAEDHRDALIKACSVVRLLSKQDYDRMTMVEGWGEDMEGRILESRKDGYKVY